jgi:hypothetical protein
VRERLGRRVGLVLGALLALWALGNDVALWAADDGGENQPAAVTTTTAPAEVRPGPSTPPPGRRPA